MQCNGMECSGVERTGMERSAENMIVEPVWSEMDNGSFPRSEMLCPGVFLDTCPHNHLRGAVVLLRLCV